MPDPQTANLQLYIPLNGADVGTWDVPVNANMAMLDAALGQTATVAVTNVNVTLSPAQYGCGTIIFTGIQTGDVVITFPAFGRIYNILNLCTNNATWIIALQIGAGLTVCAPPGEMTTVYTDGATFKYLGLGPIGTYLDFGGTSVPRWISGQSVPPYLNCDGSAFNAATYPVLNAHLGGNILPDARGRFRATLNQATGRLTGVSATNGLDGNTLLSGGGNQTIAITNMPIHNHNPIINSFPGPGYSLISALGGGGLGNFSFAGPDTAQGTVLLNSNAGSGTSYAPPSYVGGLTLIRAG